MNLRTFCLSVCTALCSFSTIQAESSSINTQHEVYIGPESYIIRRMREGGTQQMGYLNGVRIGYDRIKGNTLYYGIDAYAAFGCLEGATSGGSTIYSRKADYEIEGRIGFTVQRTNWPGQPSITPFLGVGYFEGTNEYLDPSPLTVRFRNTYPYTSVGFLIRFYCAQGTRIGFDFEAKYMYEGHQEVTDDPFNPDMRMLVMNKLQYTANMPITWKISNSPFSLSAVPFYRFRHLGGREAFPVDFKDTRFHLYGVRLVLVYQR